jgi:hypothetical protein
LLRRPEPEMIEAGAGAGAVPVSGPRQKRNRSKGGDPFAELTQKAQGSLDEMKETLFKLELRRQAGTITEEDYAREHGRLQKALRDLVKG